MPRILCAASTDVLQFPGPLFSTIRLRQSRKDAIVPGLP
jgi:hypothetical protein